VRMPDHGPSVVPFSLLPFLATVVNLGDQRLDDRVLLMIEQCANSERCRSPIPKEADHPFRSMPITDSEPSRSPDRPLGMRQPKTC